MRTAEQQLYDAAELIMDARRAAESGYLPRTKDELQLTASSQMTMAILTLAMTLQQMMERADEIDRQEEENDG